MSAAGLLGPNPFSPPKTSHLRVFRGGRDDGGGREAVGESDGDGVGREGDEAHAHEGAGLARLGPVAQESAQDLLEGVPVVEGGGPGYNRCCQSQSSQIINFSGV